MTREVMYAPARQNTHVYTVEEWRTDYREGYWYRLFTFEETPEGLVSAKGAADTLALKGKQVKVFRTPKPGLT